MRRSVLMAGVVVVAACAMEDQGDPAADEAAIREQTEALIAAFRAGHAPSAAAVFAPDGAMDPPNQRPVVGTAAITAWGERMMTGMTMVDGAVTVDEVQVADDWAVSRGNWAMTVAMGSDTLSDTTAYMMTWRREPDGRWVVTRDIWNSVRPAM